MESFSNHLSQRIEDEYAQREKVAHETKTNKQDDPKEPGFEYNLGDRYRK